MFETANTSLLSAIRLFPQRSVDLLATDEGADIEFEPERLGLAARTAEL